MGQYHTHLEIESVATIAATRVAGLKTEFSHPHNTNRAYVRGLAESIF